MNKVEFLNFMFLLLGFGSFVGSLLFSIYSLVVLFVCCCPLRVDLPGFPGRSALRDE